LRPEEVNQTGSTEGVVFHREEVKYGAFHPPADVQRFVVVLDFDRSQ
jgi:hypothetical protein